MDGVFVKSASWPYNEGGTMKNEEFQLLMKQEEGMPFWDSMDYELDLMIQAPERHLEEWLPLGASRLVFHIESILDRDHFFRGDVFDPESRMIGGEKIIEIGIAINPSTPLEEIRQYIPLVDFVQVMGILKIGFQGQPHDERSLTHIKELRQSYPELIISVDGAVNIHTAHAYVESGANRLVAGSAIYQAEDMSFVIEELRNI
jgi:ribulose-phosphate 3-epimerase